MRTTDNPDAPPLGKKIEADPPKPQPERWTPIESQPGYERRPDGVVRRGGPLPVAMTETPDDMPWHGVYSFSFADFGDEA